jgi:glucan biosynthesis protein C
MSQDPQRLHGLDAVRGYALLLGVVFHATMSFLPVQVWPVADVHRSSVLSGVFFVTHVFRMSTFFLIAGFFAHMMVQKRGLAGFVRDRLKRIALPLVVAWPIMITGILLAAGYGIYVATGTFPTQAPPSPPGPPGSFPLTHLWFLYGLLWLYAGALGLRGLVGAVDRGGAIRLGADAAVRGVLATPAAPLLLALPAAAVFYLTPVWLGWFGVPTPDSNLIPNLPAAVQFGMAFGFGWLLNRQPQLLDALRRNWALNLAAAVVLIGGCLAMLGVSPATTPFAPGLNKLVYAAAYAAAIWTGTFAAIGAALRFLSDESRVRRYIADSSYWIYLIHLPVVMVLQAAVSRLDWPWEVKFALVLAAGFALMFASYQLLVRHTFVGWVLNGRRTPRAGTSAAALPEAAR